MDHILWPFQQNDTILLEEDLAGVKVKNMRIVSVLAWQQSGVDPTVRTTKRSS